MKATYCLHHSFPLRHQARLVAAAAERSFIWCVSHFSQAAFSLVLTAPVLEMVEETKKKVCCVFYPDP